MKILLTGATGYIGSQLTARLIAEGHDVAVLVRPTSKLDVLQSIISKVHVFIYDNSYLSIYRALTDFKPEVVFHIASLVVAQHKNDNIEALVNSNVNFPTQLLEAMNQVGVKYLINTGTFWQHYQNQPYNPVNLYAATKQAFECMLEYYIQAHDFKAITLKLFDTYGPGDTRPKLFSLLREVARSGKELKMSPGNQLIDLVYIDDVLNAYTKMLKRITSINGHELFAISSKSPLSLKKLVSIYEENIDCSLKIIWGGIGYRQREVMSPCTLINTPPEWIAKTNLDAGIRSMELDSSINGLLSSNCTINI